MRIEEDALRGQIQVDWIEFKTWGGNTNKYQTEDKCNRRQSINMYYHHVSK